jgi:hypothetical protein
MSIRTSAALAAVILLAVATPAVAELPPGGTFVDDNGSVHEGYIEAVADAGITKGCNPPANSRFCPDDAVTRGQMAAFVVRAVRPGLSSRNWFVDDEGNIFENDIDRLAEAAVTRGCNPPVNDRFCPDQTLTRGEMAAFLVRAFHLPSTSTEDRFRDDDGSVFEADIDRLAGAEITLGCNPPNNDRFCPDDPVTRAQMATFLGRALHLTPMKPPPPALPAAGNPDGHAPVPVEARAEDTSSPDHVIGSGTAAGCTSAAVVNAVAQGGTITFDCGPDPLTIQMTETAKVFNDTGPEIVIDGGGLITLDGGDSVRILYMNTCDAAQVWTTSHCDDQDHPRLTVQNLTFSHGHASGEDLDGGGGAIYARGGRLKIVNSRFFNNSCDTVGPDVGGAGIRVFDQSQDLPVFVVSSTFGGSEGLGNVCSNGGGVSSIGVSWTILNSLFTYNEAVGYGANPSRAGTPGGGSGGAIYNDGNTFTLSIQGTKIEDNHANEGGGAVFFVSNDRTGHLVIGDSELRRNPSDGFETAGFPGIFYLGSGAIQVTNSVIE